MVFWSLDTETYKWNEKKQIYEPSLEADMLLCDVCDNDLIHKTFDNKDKVWDYLVERGKEIRNSKGILCVYGHNMQFDYYKILSDKHIKNVKIFSVRPFIASYEIKGKEIFKILDSMGVFKMSLKIMGDTIGYPKMEMPEEILIGKNKKEQFDIINEYCQRDTEIIIKGLEYIKKLIKKEGVNVKRFITMSQIANSFMLNKMRKFYTEGTPEHKHDIFFNPERMITWKSWRKDEIRKAYRGGKCQAYVLGKHNKVTYMDMNSMYPYAVTKIRIPMARKENMIYNPLKIVGKSIFDEIGVSKVLIKNVNDPYGFIGVRTGTDNYYIKKGQSVIGTYTNDEIKYALNNGYEIINCEWSVIYEDSKLNPYEILIKEVYEKKKNAIDEFNRYFYKGILNMSIGKLAQYKPYQEYRVDDFEKHVDYLKKNYEIIAHHNYNILVHKVKEEFEMKYYYYPMIPILVNAKGRIMLHEQMKKLPPEDIIYSDTDSIIFKNNHIDKFDVGEKMGQWKIEKSKSGEIFKNVPMLVYGKKTYMIGDDIRVVGFHKSDLDKDNFENGVIFSNKMKTIASCNDPNEWGKFEITSRDLIKQQENTENINVMLESEILLIDKEELDDVKFFMNDIKNL